MARLLTPEDAAGRRTGDPHAMYDHYRRYPYFGARARLLVRRYPTAARILVVGCGVGYLVDELITAGRPQTWGVDASAYAVDRAAAELGERAAHVLRCDPTDAAALAAAKRAAGLGKTQRFDLAVTEDVLPCLTAGEQTALLAAVRSVATRVFHVVTPGDPADPAKGPGMDWRPLPAWRAVVGGAEPVLDAESGEVLG